MQRNALLALFSLMLCLVPAAARPQELPAAERYHLRGEYWWWDVNLTSDLQKGFGDDPGTLISGEDTLGLTGGGTNMIRGAIRFGASSKLRGSWTQLDYTATQAVPYTFTFGGETFFVGDSVTTRVKGSLYTADFEYDFVKRREGYMGFYLGALVLDSDSVLVSGSKQVSQTGQVPMPMIGVCGRTYYGRRFSFEGELGGGTIGSRGKAWLFSATARFHLSDRLAAVGGYRKLHMKGDDERDSLDVRFSGWLFGGEFSL
jgi:hypothetical protein